jgi:hypothetical protein
MPCTSKTYYAYQSILQIPSVKVRFKLIGKVIMAQKADSESFSDTEVNSDGENTLHNRSTEYSGSTASSSIVTDDDVPRTMNGRIYSSMRRTAPIDILKRGSNAAAVVQKLKSLRERRKSSQMTALQSSQYGLTSTSEAVLGKRPGVLDDSSKLPSRVNTLPSPSLSRQQTLPGVAQAVTAQPAIPQSDIQGRSDNLVLHSRSMWVTDANDDEEEEEEQQQQQHDRDQALPSGMHSISQLHEDADRQHKHAPAAYNAEYHEISFSTTPATTGKHGQQTSNGIPGQQVCTYLAIVVPPMLCSSYDGLQNVKFWRLTKQSHSFRHMSPRNTKRSVLKYKSEK